MYFDTRILYVILIIFAISRILTGGVSLLEILLTLPGVLVAITFHEFAHVYAADKLGDDTARNQGRLNLNPFSHIDPIGIFMLVFAHIGWGRPVQINSNNFNRKVSARTGEAIVSVAGPLINLILAIIFAFILGGIQIFAVEFCSTQIGIIIVMLLSNTIIVNIGLGVFNLIPLPPLDGSKILMAFLPYNSRRWCEDHMQLFYIIFLIVWITPICSVVISPIIESILKGLVWVVSSFYGLFL